MIVLLFSVILITIGITQAIYTCPQNQIIYKYIPRTLDEELESPVSASNVYKKMFEIDSPWVSTTKNVDSDDRNVYFISQI